MKKGMRIGAKKQAAFIVSLCAAVMLVGGVMARHSAAATYTVTFKDLKDPDTVVYTQKYSDGGTAQALPQAVLDDGTTAVANGSFFYDTGTDVGQYVPGTTAVNADMTVYYLPDAEYTAMTTAGTAGTAPASSGTVNWYYYGDKLYIIGNGTLTLPDTTNTYVGASTAIAAGVVIEDFSIDPSGITAMYGDIGADKWGVNASSAVSDEKGTDGATSYGDGTFYSYTAPVTAPSITAQTRAKLTSTYNTELARSSVDATSAPWSNAVSRGSITAAYIGSDVKLAGNISYLFNDNMDVFAGNFTGQTSKDGETDYTALKDIYFYADTSDVTYAVGTFARMPKLEHIHRNSTADFSKVHSTAYMFYGDTLLSNGEGSLIDNIDLEQTGDPKLIATTRMFFGCENIMKPKVGDYNMSKVTNADGMFCGAKAADLTFTGDGSDPDVGKWDTSSLVSAFDMFSAQDTADYIQGGQLKRPGYGELADSDYGSVVTGAVDLSKWDLSKLATAQYMFTLNKNITSVNFDTREYTALEDISEMFARCDGLAAITGTNVQMPALKYAQYAFLGCGGSGGNGTIQLVLTAPNLTYTDFMFYHSNFKTVDMKGGSDFSSIKGSAAMFGDMLSVTAIDLSDKKLSNDETTAFMFFNDPKLSTLDVSGFDLSKDTDASAMFMNDEALTVIDTSAWQIGTVSCNMENMLYNTGVKTVNLASAGGNINNISLAFAKNKNLTSVTLPASFSNVTNALGAFAFDPALTAITPTGASFPATKAADLRGVFFGDTALTGDGIKAAGNMISSSATQTAFMFKDCPAITALSMANADTSNVVYMEGMFDGDTALSSITTGPKFKATAAKNLGTMFRGCALDNTYAQGILDSFGTTTEGAEDMYAMFEGNEDLTKLDFSGNDFSAATELSRLTYGCNSLGVITEGQVGVITGSSVAKITIPDTFGTKASSTGLKNVFYVDKGSDGAALDPADLKDDVLTNLAISSNAFPSALSSYSWGGDNRKFAVISSQTINGEEAEFDDYSDGKDATLALTAAPTLTLNGTPAPLTYSWASDKSGDTISDKDADYVAAKAKYGDGKTYTVTAKAYPTAMASSVTDGTLAPAEAEFTLGAKPTGITAVYSGPAVAVGQKYDKDKVTVTATLPDGSTATIPSSGWKASGDTVGKTGDNGFTASYGGFTASFTVPGERVIGSIVTKYSGPAVMVGDSWDEANVETTAYYADDTAKKEGFLVTPSAYSGKKVSSVGSNTYTATYNDPDQGGKAFTSQFTVPGYKEIGYITASYGGPTIHVGSDYDKKDVTVTAYYADGSGSSVLKENDWTADSLTVTAEGENTFKATYKDPYGGSFSAGYAVKGVKDGAATPADNNATPTDDGDIADLTDTYKGPGTSDASASSSSSVPTSTGVVQTGTTGRLVLYAIAILCIIAVFTTAVVMKNKDKKKKR